MNDLEQEFFLAEFAAGQKHGGVDQRQMGVGLWEIPQEAFRLKIEVLTEQSQVVGMAQKLVRSSNMVPIFISAAVKGAALALVLTALMSVAALPRSPFHTCASALRRYVSAKRKMYQSLCPPCGCTRCGSGTYNL